MKPIYAINAAYVDTKNNNEVIDVKAHKFETYKEAKAFAKKLNDCANCVIFKEKGILVLKVCDGVNVIYTQHTEIEL